MKLRNLPILGHPLVSHFLITAVLNMGYGSIFTLLAEFRTEYGFSEGELGLVASAGFFAGFASQVGLAPLADRGHTPTLIKGGVLLAAVGMFGMVVSSTVVAFVLARILFGLATGATSPAIRRLVITRYPDDLGENLGQLTAFEIAGFVAGPVLGAVLFEVGGLSLPFLAMGGLNLVLFLWVMRLDLSTPPGDGEKRATAPLLRIRGIQSALLAGAAFYLAIAYFEATWALLLTDLGAENWAIGLSLSLFVLPLVVVAPRAGRLAQRIGHQSIIVWSIGATILCTALYGFATAAWVAMLISLVHAVADGFTMPANQIAVAMSSPKEQIATAQGLFSATGTLVGGVAAFLSGWLYEIEGPRTLYLLCALTMAIFLLLSMWRAEPRERAPRDTKTTEASYG